MEVLSTIIIITQSGMKYLMKVNLEQLFYESGHGGSTEILSLLPPWEVTFSEALVFKETWFLKSTSLFWKITFFKSLLPFITFVNSKRAYLAQILLLILCLFFNVALAQL